MNYDQNDFWYEHKDKIIGGILGLIVALLFVIFGFWQGLFIIVLVLVGAFLGSRTDLRRELQHILNRLWYNRER